MELHSALELTDIPKNLFGNWIVLTQDSEREDARRILLNVIKQTLQVRRMRVTHFSWVNKPETIGYKFTGIEL